MVAEQISTILVVGATGNQGSAVVDSLIASNHPFNIRGLTRDADSRESQKLKARGVEMVEGDLEDPASLEAAVDGVDGVFVVTDFWTYGYDRQVQQGKNIADAAKNAGVELLVLTGVGGHDQDTGLPHFDAAAEIDDYIQELGIPNVILKPTFFFHNFEAFIDDIRDGTLALPLEEGVALQMMDVADVGTATAVAFENPREYSGRRFDLAGDELTLEEAAQTFSEVMGREVQPVHLSIEDARAAFGDESADMFVWFNEQGYTTDEIEEEFGFDFADLEIYLRHHEWDRPAEKTPDQLSEWAQAVA